eukprot:5264940-Amphidinium_carterae.1
MAVTVRCTCGTLSAMHQARLVREYLASDIIWAPVKKESYWQVEATSARAHARGASLYRQTTLQSDKP